MADGQVPIVNGNSMEIPQNDGLGDLTRDLGPLITQQPMNIPIPPPVQKERMQVQQGGVGRTKAETRRNTTASIAGNIANFVGTVKRNKDAQHNRILQYDLERLMGAMQHPEDPQNKQIINDILSDPKKVKAIEKSLDIHLLDPKENPPETKAFFNAAKKHKEGQAGGGQQAPQQRQPQTIPMSQPQRMPGANGDRYAAASGGQMSDLLNRTPQQGGGPAGGGGFQSPTNGQQPVQPSQQQQGRNPLEGLDPKVSGILRKIMPPVAPGINPTWQIYTELVKAGVLMSADKKADVQIRREEIQGKLAVADKNYQGRLIGHLMTMLSSKYTADMGYQGKMDAAFQNHLYRTDELATRHKNALGEIKAATKVTMLKSNDEVLNSTITEFRKSKDAIALQLFGDGDKHKPMDDGKGTFWNNKDQVVKYATLAKQYQFYVSAINQMETARRVNGQVLGDIVGGATNGGNRGNGGTGSSNTQPTGDAGKSVGPVTPEQLVNSTEFPFAFQGSSYSGANADSDEKDDSDDDE
jgi:hypothetical protein